MRGGSQLSIGSPVSSSQTLKQRLDSSAGDDSASRQSSSGFMDPENPLIASGKEAIEPWEAFDWTRLVKISDQLYSEDIKKEGGLVSVIAVSGVIAVGTTRSLVFVYDYYQNLKCILGDTTRGK